MPFIQTDTVQQDIEQRKVTDEEGLMPRPVWDDKQFLEFVKHYSEDDNIPIKARKSKWAIFSKSFLYTFLEEKDVPMIDIWGNILKIDSLISQPPHRITFDEVHELDQAQFYMFCTAKRAIGTHKDIMNERSLQNTQIAQTIATQTIKGGTQPNRGVLTKLKNMF